MYLGMEESNCEKVRRGQSMNSLRGILNERMNEIFLHRRSFNLIKLELSLLK